MGILRHAFAAGFAAATLSPAGCSGELATTGSTWDDAGGGAAGPPVYLPDIDTGQLRANLEIGPGVAFTSLPYAIHGPNTYTGSITIGDAQSIELVVGGIVAGNGYRLTINGNDSSGDPCTVSSGVFSILSGQVTQTVLGVTCAAPPDGAIAPNVSTGPLKVDASVLLGGTAPGECPGISAFSINPAEIAMGQSAQLALQDTDPTALITWSVTGIAPAGAGGTFSDPHSANPTFQCSQGSSQVSVTATIAPANDAAAASCAGSPFQKISTRVNCESGPVDAGLCGDAAFGTGCGDGG